jgi:hypothetical protein
MLGVLSDVTPTAEETNPVSAAPDLAGKKAARLAS